MSTEDRGGTGRGSPVSDNEENELFLPRVPSPTDSGLTPSGSGIARGPSLIINDEVIGQEHVESPAVTAGRTLLPISRSDQIANAAASIQHSATLVRQPSLVQHQPSVQSYHSQTQYTLPRIRKRTKTDKMANQQSSSRPSLGQATTSSPWGSTKASTTGGSKRTFPNFHDGDVLIISPSGKQWRLHALMLSQSSSKLRDLFESSGVPAITPQQRKDGKLIRYKVEMVHDPQADGVDPQSLKFKDFKIITPGYRPNVNFPFNNGTGAANETTCNEIYDNLFKCIYHLSPDFGIDASKAENKDEYISRVTEVLQAASYLDAVGAIRATIEASLLRMSSTLWINIRAKPEGWVHIAALLQSDLIFRECIIHIVGRFHLKDGIDVKFLQDEAHGDLGTMIWELVKRKAAELKFLKHSVERRLIDFFPPRMIHVDTESSMPGRAMYSSDIYCWMGLTLIRQYICSGFQSNFHHRASDGGLAFYRSIGDENSAWINATTFERFHEVFDMSGKGRRCLVEHVEMLKRDYRLVVAPLLADNAQAQAEGSGHPHFTCTEVMEHELPWHADFEGQGEDFGDGFEAEDLNMFMA